jgi:hypothetical protein
MISEKQWIHVKVMVESRFISTNGEIDTSNEHEYGKVFFYEKSKEFGKFQIKYYKFWRF